MRKLARRRALQLLGSLLAAPAVLRAQTDVPPAAVRLLLDGPLDGLAAPYLLAQDQKLLGSESFSAAIAPGTTARAAIGEVASGKADACIGDFNRLIRLLDSNGKDSLRAVAILDDRPAYAIAGRKSRGVSADPKSLEGKRFAAPEDDASRVLWPVFRAAQGIDDSKCVFETVAPAVREQMLAQGEADAVFGYSHNLAVSLAARGVPADDIVLISMSSQGFDLYGNALIVSADMLAGPPEVLRGLVRGVLRGLKAAAADPAAAIAALAARAEGVNRETELLRLRLKLSECVLTPEVKANGLGALDSLRFERGLDQLAKAAAFKKRPRPDDVFTAQFLPVLDQDRRID